MKKPKILNHPAKRSSIAVSPIRDMNDVKSIQKLLANNPRDLLLFVMGINNGLRVGDFLKLSTRIITAETPSREQARVCLGQ